MLSVNGRIKVFLCTEPMDMRKGFEGIAGTIQNQIRRDPFSGHWYVFRNKRGDRLKLLHWDGSGLVLLYKRLDEGQFHWPRPVDGLIRLTPSELSLLIDGVDWRRLAHTEPAKPQAA